MPRVRMSEDVINGFQIRRDKPCQCGRRSTFVHCPHCGSTNFYGLSEKSRKAVVYDLNGNEVNVRVFACKACLKNFMENDSTLACKAEPTAAQERENVVHRSLERASPQVVGEVGEYVRHLAEKRGVKKPALHVETDGFLEARDREKTSEPPKLDEGGES